MICFAALVPHNPALLTRTDARLDDMRRAIARITSALVETAPDVVVLLTAHAGQFERLYTLPVATSFNVGAGLKKLGVIVSAVRPTLMGLFGRLQSFARQQKIPLRSVETKEIDSTCATALQALGLPASIPVMIIGTCERTIIDHNAVGYEIKDFLHNNALRVAVITVGEPQRGATQLPQWHTALAQRSIALLSDLWQKGTSSCIAKPMAFCFGLLRGFPLMTTIVATATIDDASLIAAILFSE